MDYDEIVRELESIRQALQEGDNVLTTDFKLSELIHKIRNSTYFTCECGYQFIDTGLKGVCDNCGRRAYLQWAAPEKKNV